MSMVFALVLFGCADDGTACERLSIEPERYGSKLRCEARQEVALESDVARRSDHPLVISQCLRASAVPAMGHGPAKLTVRFR